MLLLALLLATDAASVYRIDAQALKAKHGAPATAHVEVVPQPGAHVSPDAPITFKLQSGALLKLDKVQLGRNEAKETAQKGVSFDVPFTAATAGTEELRGKLSFFICTDTLCEKQSRDVAVPVTIE